MKRLIISLVLALALLMIPASGVFAGTTANVDVTAVPSLVDVSISNASWTINGINGNGAIEANQTYYSQKTQGETTVFGDPVLTANCWNVVTNNSTVNITLKADMADFAGGTVPMTNGDGTQGANAFAAWVCAAGSNWSTQKQIMKTTNSTVFWTSSSAGDDIEIGFGVQTQSGAWSDYTTQTTTILLTAAPS